MIVVSSRIDADATLIIDGDQPLVVIRPAQTFDSAVLAVQAALRADFPHLHPDQIRAMVRAQLPDLPTMDRLMGVGESPPPIDRCAPVRSGRQIVPRAPRRRRSAAIGQILLAAVIAAAGVGVGYMVGQHGSRTAAVLDRVPVPAATLSAFAADPAFRQFAAAGQMRCTSLGPLQARCTDVDQLVMYSEAAISPNSVAYTFSYGTERIYMMAFRSNADAAAWAQESGSQKTLDNLSVVTRFALWGSDAARLREYQELIVEAARQEQTRPVSASLTVKMPDRLAALAFGTLGVVSSRLDRLDLAPNAPGLVAAVHLVLGGETEPPASARVTASADGSLVTTMLGVDQTASPPAKPVPPPPPPPPAEPSEAPNPDGGAKSPEPPPETPRPSPKPSTGTLSPSATPSPTSGATSSPTPPAESGQPPSPGTEAPAGLPVPEDHTDPAGTSEPDDAAPPSDEVSETPVESLLLAGPPTGRPPTAAPSTSGFLEGRRRALRPVR
ncbi:hypothetical protein ACPC54_30645 [Kitasatospora sp. NPDC094028]